MKRSIKHICIGIISLLCIGGMSACGESRTPDFKKALSAPENLYMEIHHSPEETNYILTWDEDRRADGYIIEVGEDSIRTKETELDLTSYLFKLQTCLVKVTSVGSGVYANSEAAKLECEAEEPTEQIYRKGEEGYEIYSGVLNLSGKVVIPDYYKGEKICVIQDRAFSWLISTEIVRNVTFESVRIPRTVTKIGAYAFSNCKELKEITFSENVKSLGDGAFLRCESLKSVVLPDNITEYGLGVFDCCSGLESVSLPESMKEIPESIFSNCENLTEIILPKKVTKIHFSAFQATGLKEISIPKSVVYIGTGAFGNCDNLTRVEIPSGIETLEDAIFSNCDALVEVKLPDGLINIRKAAFNFCENLEKLELPINLINIGEYSFTGCKKLTEIKLPDSLLNIGSQAFKGCSGLREVELPSQVSLEDGVFFECSGLENIFVAEGNPKYKSIDGNLYTIDGTTLLQYAAGKTAESFVLSENVTKLGSHAFAGCDYLKEIELPTGLLNIGDYAFASCDGITVLEIPSTIEIIEESAFSSAKNLETVILPNTLEVIWSKSFSGSDIKYLDIPDGVVKIEGLAFNYCKFDYIIVPKTIVSVNGVFSWFCSIGKIYYEGNATEWSGIEEYEQFTGELSSVVYYYSKEEPPLSEDGTAYDGNYWYYDENGVPMVWTKEETEE